jgi:cytidylate kinase
MIRVITISREYGSGGSAIARLLAARLRWRLIDDSLICEIARQARVETEVAERFDECVDPWFHRMIKALWRGGYEGSASRVEGEVFFDADTMAALWRSVIQEAAKAGECVAVGRGGQCLLQGREDVFHVSVYAPVEERVEILRASLPPDTDLHGVIEESDRRRAAYIRRYFGQDWADRDHYNLMICSCMGTKAGVAAILAATGLTEPATRLIKSAS